MLFAASMAQRGSNRMQGAMVCVSRGWQTLEEGEHALPPRGRRATSAAMACGPPRQPQEMAKGLFRELNPGPLAPEARIMPLDQTADDLRLPSLVWAKQCLRPQKNAAPTTDQRYPKSFPCSTTCPARGTNRRTARRARKHDCHDKFLA